MFITAPFLGSAHLHLFIHRDELAWAWIEIEGEPLWPVVIGRA